MKYMGSKNRVAKHILPIMLEERKPDQWWVEPFVGGGNMIDKVGGKRLGADCNENTIDALITIRDSLQLIPKNNKVFTEEDYKRLREKDYGFNSYAGYAFSYGGKWMGGWRRDRKGERDYVLEAYNNAVKQSPRLQDVIFVCCSYDELHIPSSSLIYCDPPYAGTTKYSNDFDHKLFWQWCRDKANEGHKVFVSEYNAPEDFTCIWKKEIVSSLTKNTGSKKGVEKLFTI